nr:amino acid adenylation domain-containing protein [Candidatus Aminicenantes bacterium]NIM84481.1 amino acid adenylation domain-containing protein [Candidatus Aminicenantes bacterium]NIN24002.1 amino acid adenylation domain-containing protein [Candidatus Aminicenantes bacterium]NIN47716.1 amino acid adenylation domain-containing protein [Candidatus Aminicenantes bacterium]NIN90646.1 amino acid adenylation domain-containing protein [Candidatus Aminicenantes bacterium]
MEGRSYSHRLAAAANQNIKEKNYWLKKLSGNPVKTSLLYDFKKAQGAEVEVSMGTLEFQLTGELFSKLMALSNKFDYTLHIVLVSGLVVLLEKYTQTRDILICSPIYKQEKDIEFINTVLVLRNQVKEFMTFKELLLQTKQTVVEATEHQNYPLQVLMDQLNSSGPGSFQTDNTLFDIVLLLENIHDRKYIQDADYHILFSFLRTDETIEGRVEYDIGLYRKETIERVVGHFTYLVEKAVSDVNTRLEDIDLLSEEEKEQILYDFNDTALEYPEGKTLVRLFEEQAARTPDGVSIVGSWQLTVGKKERSEEPVQLTYKELNKKSNQLAHFLRSRGVTSDTIVGILVEPSIDMIVGILGILKAGGAYLPIDPNYPQERIDFMLKDSGTRLLVSELSKVSGGIEVVKPGELSEEFPIHLTHLTHPTHLCYVIYTSGTTGRPKGVVVEHRNVIINLFAFYREFNIKPTDTVIQLSSYTFDASVEEICPVLLRGGKLAIPAVNERLDIHKLVEFIVKHKVNIIDCTPLLLNEFNKTGGIKGTHVHTFISGGDVLKEEYVDRLVEAGKVYNTYGPTESTVCAAYYRHCGSTGTGIPIGKPIANYSVYILDENMRLLPVGVIGEICVAGPGVTRGYLNQPELTAEKFLPVSYRSNRSYRTYISQKIYKTGDLGRWLPDGNIEYIGRKDLQVKIRGFRIETGEIESLLKRKAGIKEVVVTAREDKDGKKYLCAYWVSEGGGDADLREQIYDESELREFLQTELPEYMIPSFFVFLDKFPLTLAGKVDRRALPKPEVKTAAAYVEPQDGLQERVWQIWHDIFDLDRIGIYDNFFEIGGHSLRGLQVVNGIQKEFGVKLPIAEIFKHPTIKELSEVVKDAARQSHSPIEPVEEREYYELSHSQKRVWVVSQFEGGLEAFNMPAAYFLEGVLDRGAFENVFATLLERHESLRTVFITIHGEPKQIIKLPEEIGFKIEISDFSQVKDGEARAAELADAEENTRFDLARGPLLRARLLRFEKKKHVFLFNMHHIISDALSIDVLLSEMLALYEVYRQGANNSLEPLQIQYKDFAAWQNRQLSETEAENHKDFWMKQLHGVLPELDLPVDKERPAVMNYRGDTLSLHLDKEMTRKLRELGSLSGQRDVTLFMTLLAALNVLLYGYTGQTDIIIGTTIAGREHADLENQIGFYLNTLALRTRFKPGDTFIQLLQKTREVSLSVYNHQVYPFDKLVEDIGLERDISKHPIFNVLLNMINYNPSQTGVSTSSLLISPFEAGYHKTKFDLTVYVYEGENTLTLTFEYNVDLFENKTILLMLKRFQALLGDMVRDFSIPISHMLLKDKINLLPITPIIPEVDHFDASYHQERLWFIDAFEAGHLYESSPIYHNIPLILKISGPLDVEVLEKSIRQVIARHKALRTRIVTVDNKSVQVVDPDIDFKFNLQVIEGGSGTFAEAVEQAVAESKRPFSMDKEPLIRGRLIRWEHQWFLLGITFHHITADKKSLELFVQETALIYDALIHNKNPNIPDLPFHYVDFSRWQSEFSEEAVDTLLFYWRRKLHGKLQALELPTDRPRAKIHTFREARQSFTFPESLTGWMKTYVQQEGADEFVLLLSVFKVLLHVYCAQDEIIVGTTVDNRHHPGRENMMGPAANLLVLRSFISGSDSFKKVIDDVQRTVKEAYRYRDMPFDRLVLALNPDIDMSRTALFDVLFRYEEKPFLKTSMGNVEVEVMETNLGWGKYDLNVLVQKKASEEEFLEGVLVYNADYYDASRIRRLIDHYRVLLEAVLDAPLQPISRFEILTPQERQQLLWEWNGKTADYPQDKQIHEIFEHQVSRTPDHIAMEGAHELHELPEMSITYSELDRKSNQLAHLLREKGVLADSIVAIMMDRSIDMIIGIIGILKARGAYLPIDPDYPHDRIDYMLKDSNAWVLVSELSEVSKVSEETEIVRLSELSEEHPTHLTYPTHPTHLCYIIYTSGTTGRPKGVMVEHRNVVSLFFNNGFQFDFNSMDVWTMFHSHCFDFSVWEIFGALLYGGKLIVVPKMVAMDTEQYVSMVRQYGVTVLNQTPSAFYRFIDVEVNQEKQDLPVRYVIFGGEALSPGKLKEWRERYPQTRLINMFGITETTVHVTYKEITGREIEENLSHIGKPIPTLTSYVMDIHQRLLPVGVYGELYVGGAGVSRGYLNQPQLTAERFPENPHRLGETLYRSGDLVRLLENGEMVYSGRIDHQVQLRGFRVELEEIRNQLLKIAGIRDAVVVDKEDASGDIYLCAYIAADEAVKPAEARHLLGRVLPDYMIPAYVIKINKIPLTPNGKVDRKALPEPEFKAAEEDLAAPLDVLQQKLVEIWADVLNIEKENIGINTSFFDMGGHSLKATILAARVHKELNVQLPLAQVFTTPTIKELSNYIRRTKRERYISIEPAEEKEYYPLSSTQKRLYILQQLASDSPYYNMPDVIEPEESIDEEKLEAVFKKMIERHEVLRTSFEMVAEEPVQRVHKEVKFKIEVKVEKEILSSETLIEHFIRPFDLSQAPLLRAKLIKTPRGRPILLIDMHHIITDATSQEILKKGFYALCSGEQLPDLRLQYKDYSEWQYSREQEEVVKEQEAYWIKEFSHDLPVLNLPTDYPRPLLQRFEGHWVNFALNTEETRILKTIAQENDGTLYMCLLAVFNVLFSKLSGQEDIILGTPIAARRHADLQYVVGMLLNTLPMRNYPSAHKPFNQFFEEVKKRTLEAYENQEYPFENLVGNLLVDRDTSRNPVFDVMLVLMNQAEYSGEISEMPVQPPYRHLKRTSRFDMSFVAVDMGKNLYFGLEYSTNLFIPSTIEKYITYFKNIIRHLGSDMQQKISDIEYITREEKEAILELSSGVREIPSVDLTVHEIFEEEAGQVPDNTALVFEGQHMSYGELNRRSNRLARVLREKGVRANAVVGVMVERSIEMIIALLAVLKAGGAYVPIDPEYPEQRILTMLEDSRASLLITTGNLVGRFSVTALKGMKGVKQEEELVVTPPQAQIKDFDAIPIPDRTLIDYEKYHRYIGEAPAKNTITMQATRGCPYNCLYCHKIWPKTHVARSSENVFKEISYAYEAGVRRFVFIDDIFNLDKKNAERLLETIVKSGLDIRLFFPNGFRADILSRDFIDLMMVAGTVNLDVALESASPRIQRLIKKNLNLERFKENVDYITRKYPQVILEMEMMHGFPTETEKEAMMTLDFLKEFRWVHFPNLHVLKIFPNTDMCRFAIESGISEAVIERSADLAFHELPDTLPFPKSFTRQFQAKFMGEYFLLKERLLDVLPHQMKVLTEDELVQKYDSYL